MRVLIEGQHGLTKRFPFSRKLATPRIAFPPSVYCAGIVTEKDLGKGSVSFVRRSAVYRVGQVSQCHALLVWLGGQQRLDDLNRCRPGITVVLCEPVGSCPDWPVPADNRFNDAGGTVNQTKRFEDFRFVEEVRNHGCGMKTIDVSRHQ